MHLSSAMSVAPARACRRDGLVDLRFRPHPGRDHERLAGRGHPPDERQVHELERRDLEGRHVEPGEEVDRGRVERAREAVHAERFGERLEPRLPLPRHVRLLVEVVQGRAFPQRAGARAERLRVARDRDRVGRVGLELDGVGARLVRGMDELDRDILVLAMVGRQLGDDVDGMAGPDRPASDAERCGHVVIPESVVARALIESTARSASSAAWTSTTSAAALVREEADPDRPESGGPRPHEVLARVVADVDGSRRLDGQEPARHQERGRGRLAVAGPEVVRQDDHVEAAGQRAETRQLAVPGPRRSRRTRRPSAGRRGAARRARRPGP